MEVITLLVGDLATNCYILKAGKDALILDPGDDAPKILREVSGLDVKGIVLTHGHFDHTLAAGEVERETCAPLYIGEKDAHLLYDPAWMKPMIKKQVTLPNHVRTVGEGFAIAIGDRTLKVMETPGHSSGSISLYTPGFLFVGDLIFRENVGRADLPGGSFETLKESILTKVMSLSEDTVIYPGHGSETTVGHEMRNNPLFN